MEGENDKHRGIFKFQEVEQKYERLEGVLFPPEIVALPHVIKQIDELLMDHGEAVQEATETGQLEWLKQLLPTVNYDHLTLFNTVASYGHLDMIKWLVSQIRNHAGQLTYYTPYFWKEAVMEATYTGHHNIVKFLLEDLKRNADDEDEVNKIAWKVLKTSAYNGNLKVAQCAAEYAHETELTGSARKYSKALTYSIDRGHFEIIHFLINEPKYHWDLEMAFEQALRLKEQNVLEAIYEVDHEVTTGASLITTITMKGPQDRFNHSDLNTQTVHGAFICSSRCGRVDIIEILLESDLVSEKMIDEGFQSAARLGAIDSVEFLFSKRLLSTQSVNTAFVDAGSINVTKFLYNNADIPSKTIVAAFKMAVGFDTSPKTSGKERDSIAIFLHKEKCISMEIINHGFLIAARSRRPEVVENMRNDIRLTSTTVFEAFTTAIEHRCIDMVKASYNRERFPQELVNRNVLDAAYNGDPEIVEFLADNSCLSSSVLQEAFLIAAGRNRKGVVKLLGTRIAYPSDVVRDALDVTTNKRLKKFLRTKITT